MNARYLLGAVALGFGLSTAHAQVDGTLEDQSVRWLQEFIRIDTVNPPGNEYRAVEFYSDILDAEGIEYETAESAPGRGNIWARLEGAGDEPALILLQHTDVVPADEEFWSIDPFSGNIRDGDILGRGARDMKGLGVIQLATFLALHRSGVELNRDVVFLATADEEAGGEYGVGWLIDNRPDIFEGAGILLNEGGGTRRDEDEIIFSVEVTQKVPVWLRLEAIDEPGHGSSPRTTSAVTRIVDASSIIRANPFEPRIIPQVERYFAQLSEGMTGEWRDDYADLSSAVEQPGFLDRLQASRPGHHSLTRDTCSITRLQGSDKINVVPPRSWAELDCRILPDKPAEEFVEEMQAMIADTGVEIDVIMAFTPAISSTSSRLYESIRNVTGELYPGSRVLASVSTGFTDSHFTRDLGIVSYGFNPLITEADDHTGVHGNDEQVPENRFRQAVYDYYAVVSNVVRD